MTVKQVDKKLYHNHPEIKGLGLALSPRSHSGPVVKPSDSEMLSDDIEVSYRQRVESEV